ncbi:MAG: SMC-Scp complex subunit ScpB [Saprospiraceae bacterium]
MQTRPSLIRHLEALLFSAGEPLSPEDILAVLSESVAPELTLSLLDDALEELREYLAGDDRTFQLQLTGGGWQLLTKPAYYPTLSKYFKQQSGKRLSKAALETLSIVAYRQPVTRADVEAVRGVGSDYAINKLLERELVTIIGRDQGPGRPLLYATSPQFMDYFGLADISDLPKLREMIPTDNSIGEMPDITEPTALLQQKIDNANVTINNEATEDAESEEIVTAATIVAVAADLLGFEDDTPPIEAVSEASEVKEEEEEEETAPAPEIAVASAQLVANAPKPDLNEAWEEALAAPLEETTEVMAETDDNEELLSSEE